MSYLEAQSHNEPFLLFIVSAGPNTVVSGGEKKSERRKEKNEEGRTVNVPVNYCVEDSGVKLSALSLASGRWILYVRGDVTGSRATHSLN